MDETAGASVGGGPSVRPSLVDCASRLTGAPSSGRSIRDGPHALARVSARASSSAIRVVTARLHITISMAEPRGCRHRAPTWTREGGAWPERSGRPGGAGAIRPAGRSWCVSAGGCHRPNHRGTQALFATGRSAGFGEAPAWRAGYWMLEPLPLHEPAEEA